MDSISFLHLADTHLGKSTRDNDHKARKAATIFEGAIDLVLRDHLDFMIISGDVFDHPRVQKKHILDALNQLRRLTRKGIGCAIVAGNHDKSSRTLHSPIASLGVLANVTVFREIGVKTINNISLHCIPYQSKKSLRNFKNIQDRLMQRRERISILAMHQSVIDFDLGFNIYQSTDPYIHRSEINSDFDYVALGHIHIRQTLPHPMNPDLLLHYPSSPYVVSSRERGMKKALSLVNITDTGSEISDLPIPTTEDRSESSLMDQEQWREWISTVSVPE